MADTGAASIECNAIMQCFKPLVDGIAASGKINELVDQLVKSSLLESTTRGLGSLTDDQKANQIVLRVHGAVKKSGAFEKFVKALETVGLGQVALQLQTKREGNNSYAVSVDY